MRLNSSKFNVKGLVTKNKHLIPVHLGCMMKNAALHHTPKLLTYEEILRNSIYKLYIVITLQMKTGLKRVFLFQTSDLIAVFQMEFLVMSPCSNMQSKAHDGSIFQQIHQGYGTACTGTRIH